MNSKKAFFSLLQLLTGTLAYGQKSAVLSYNKTLYSDLEKLRKDEQRRFELLIAHWDVGVQRVDPEK